MNRVFSRSLHACACKAAAGKQTQMLQKQNRSAILQHRSVSDRSLVNQGKGDAERKKLVPVKPKWVMPRHREFFMRRDRMIEEGTMHEDRRSKYSDWNFDSELYALGARLKENFDSELLVTAVTDKSSVDAFMLERADHGLQATPTHEGSSPSEAPANHNAALAAQGAELILDVCEQFVAAAYPALPQEGVRACAVWLNSDEVMALVGTGYGLREIILAEPYPPSAAVLARAARAVVGALSGGERAATFVVETIAVHLHSRDVLDLWQIEDPIATLKDILSRSGSSVEPRLVNAAGRNTLESVYKVALYDASKKYLSSGYGESVSEAVSSASLEALRGMFGVTDSSPPLPFNPSLPPSFARLPHSPLSPSDVPQNQELENFNLESADQRFSNIVMC